MDTLYFGLKTPQGEVSPLQWQEFVDAEARIQALIRAYKARFRQESVLRAKSRAEISF